MKGKNKCRILKEIRQRIADENDIPYVTRECTYQGDCAGTCPRCEAELRYLERELEKRQRLGKAVAVVAVAAAISLGASGCVDQLIEDQTAGMVAGGEPLTAVRTEPTEPTETAYALEGDVVFVPETTEPETPDPTVYALEGDVGVYDPQAPETSHG